MKKVKEKKLNKIIPEMKTFNIDEFCDYLEFAEKLEKKSARVVKAFDWILPEDMPPGKLADRIYELRDLLRSRGIA